MSVIKCCKDCVAPKRHPGCHGACQEYLAEKAEHDRLKTAYDRERKIESAIMGQRYERVEKALKYRRKRRI